MIPCPDCGRLNKEGATECVLCKTVLKEVKVKELKKQRIKRINAVAEGKDIKNQLYSMVRIVVLTLNPVCQVPKCLDKSNQVHHEGGHDGFLDDLARVKNIPLFLDMRAMLAVCDECHRVIEANPEQSKELGYSIKRTNL